MTPSTGKRKPKGTLKGRRASGLLMRSMMTAAHTTTKANSVPIEVISPTHVDGGEARRRGPRRAR